ncbi:MAG: hypothetical protein AVDCRST_MAG75-3291 [uncultured Propionibacteriaceae bacterium]|uniref:Uncharacterized protein n=1 Tax=uncultured Propionibacteriaceae bacterium TaxID=257457 RepID=A0A6J4PK91_9ACTN|nr:MAG: hypothetical protein AVDCRST_MAG75-3291 [uncultured Propionibacteriaceae bacterium]
MTHPAAATPASTGWRKALAFALVGEMRDDLDAIDERGGRGDVDTVLDALGGVEVVLHHRNHQRGAGRAWPHRVAAALCSGVGPAQFQALLDEAVAKTVAQDSATGRPVVSSRPLSAEGVGLSRDVPPHHTR